MLISNFFIFKLFKFYKLFLNCINILNTINLEPLKFFLKINNSVNLCYQSRSFSTYSPITIKKNNNDFTNIPELDPEFVEESQKRLAVPDEKELKRFKKAYGGGYLGYTYINNFGNVSNFYNTDRHPLFYIENLESELKEYVNEISENVTYTILPVLRWQYANGEYHSLTISKSIKITRFISINLIAEKLLYDISDILVEYDLRDADLELFMMGRPWLSTDEFNLDRIGLAHLLNEQIENKLSSWTKSSIKNTPDYSNLIKDYAYKDILMDNYGEPVLDSKKNLLGYKIKEGKFVSIETYTNADNLICNQVSIKEFDQSNLSFIGDPITSWIDVKTEFGFIRELKNKKYYYDKNNILFNVETTYSCMQFPLLKKAVTFDNKIGTIDFETYASETFSTSLGAGYHQVYAGGWATEGLTKLFYINKAETGEQFIHRIFSHLFLNKKLNGYTFYLHNLGRFDSIFIIKSLILIENVEIIPLWKDNSILSLTIKQGDFIITLLDSLQLISGSLESILKSFECNTQKGFFPYTFVNKENLYYIGDKPSKEFYNSISESDYQAISTPNWDLKKETLIYLKSDLEGLLEVLNKFSNIIYNNYSLNITKFKTLPSLVLAVYRSSYIPTHLIKDFKMIKGELEKEIRSSYFGGNVDVFINHITKGYLYDINSQYSKAMLEDMPVGDPVLSLESDLNKIFGFVYGEIYCPDENTLQVPFIQYKDPLGKMNSCPRGKFKRLIFSEEIKYALQYGYKIDIEYCYQFKRGKGLFTKYVDDHYKIKVSSTDPVKRSIAKLFLNSLYGRLGIKDLDNIMQIVDKQEAEYLDKNTNVSILSELTGDKYLVKYSGLINDKLRKAYKTDPIVSIKKKI